MHECSCSRARQRRGLEFVDGGHPVRQRTRSSTPSPASAVTSVGRDVLPWHRWHISGTLAPMNSTVSRSDAPQLSTDVGPVPSAFELQGIRKCYGAVTALDGITLRAEEGSVFGLLGPNGSGKSTIVKVLSTLTIPDDGRATVKGIDVVRRPAKVRERGP